MAKITTHTGLGLERSGGAEIGPRTLSEEFFESRTTRDRSLSEVESILNFLRRCKFWCPPDNVRSLPGDFLAGTVEFLRGLRHAPVLLDCACGHARMTRELVELIPNLRAYAFDLYPVGEPTDRLKVAAHDIDLALPLDKGSVDLSICIAGTRYLKDPLFLVNEMLRVTRRGGYIVINGADAFKYEPPGRSDDVVFFSDFVFDYERVEVYRTLDCSDWVILRVRDPDARLNCVLNKEASYTIECGTVPPEKIGDCARFIYRSSNYGERPM